MSILKAKSQSKLSEFVGVFLAPQTRQYLVLYSLAKGITKSEIIRGQIEQWIKEQPVTAELVLEIIYKLQEEWDSKDKSNNDLAFYITNIKGELHHKGISNDIIQIIINGINDDNQKSERT
jgi:hypothetical protein